MLIEYLLDLEANINFKMLIDYRISKLITKVYVESKPQKFGEQHNFYSKLESFADKVVPELTQTNLLFDEYTPHDQYHIDSLIQIADKLLGDTVINSLNGCEACILACAIYGHDWGMAVSLDEKELITTGKLPTGKKQTDFALLTNENSIWTKFAKTRHLKINEFGYVLNESLVPKEIWREYVRETHAERSKASTKLL